MVKNCVGKVITAGKHGSGKTSLSMCLQQWQDHTWKSSDETIIINYSTWKLTDNHTVPVLDLGGHESYTQIARFFICDDESNITLLIHDIELVDHSEYDITFALMRDIYTHSPKCVILPVLTKTDTLGTEEVERRKDSFSEFMENCIEMELKGLKNSSKCKEIAPSIDSKKKVKLLRKSLRQIRERLRQKNIYVVSCKENFGLDRLRSDVIKIFRENEEFMSNKCYKLYQWILENCNKELPEGMLEDDTFSTITDSTTTTESSYESQIEHTALKYLKTDEIYQSYCELQNNGVKTQDMWNEFKKYMSFLHSRGLLLWFENLPQAKQVIFHDLNSFALLLEIVFNHHIAKDLEFKKLTPSQKKIINNSDKELKYHVTILKSEGILSTNLLRILLENVRLTDKMKQ